MLYLMHVFMRRRFKAHTVNILYILEELFQDLAPLLWNSFGTMAALLQVLLHIPFVTLGFLLLYLFFLVFYIFYE